MPIAGPAILKFDNAVPLTMRGSWNVSFSIPVHRAYGQGQIGKNGSVKPGSGYIGSALGTAKSVKGSFKFSVDYTGEAVKSQVLSGAFRLFTVDFPLGDPAASSVPIKAIDCHFDDISIENDGENGKLEISGSMSAGDLQGAEPDDL